MILGNLLPDTAYEVAVLPVNKMRSGPFSDMVTARTKGSLQHKVLYQSSRCVPHVLKMNPPFRTTAFPQFVIYTYFSVPRSITPSKTSTVPRPYSLFVSTTSTGLVQLSWNKPNFYLMSARRLAMPKMKILGFLIEYRWTSMNSGKEISLCRF